MGLEVGRITQFVAPIGSRGKSGRDRSGRGFKEALEGEEEGQGPPQGDEGRDPPGGGHPPTRPGRRPRSSDGKGLKVDLLA